MLKHPYSFRIGEGEQRAKPVLPLYGAIAC
jgi:hypothetical protein